MNYFVISLIVLTVIIVLSFVIKGIKAYRQHKFIEDDIAWQLSRAKEMDISLGNISFDANNSLIDPRTGRPVVYGN
jgi:hypothetical protein